MKQAPACAGLQTFNSHGTSMISPSFADNELRKVSRSSLSGVITVSTVFGKDGRFIYMGQSKGFLSVLDANSLQFLDVVKVRIRMPSLPGTMLSWVLLHFNALYGCCHRGLRRSHCPLTDAL